jgi:hypothetical protein
VARGSLVSLGDDMLCCVCVMLSCAFCLSLTSTACSHTGEEHTVEIRLSKNSFDPDSDPKISSIALKVPSTLADGGVIITLANDQKKKIVPMVCR